MSLDDSPLGRLRSGTADLHAEAERHVRILDPDADEATYARFLARMLGFHAPLEDRLARCAPLADAGFYAVRRRKQGLLAADLAALGVDADPLPRCERLPAVDALARAVGAAYVLEGSTLGGRFILARLPAALAPWKGRATAFLEGYGGATGVMWRRFLDLAAGALVDAPALEDAVASARRTFELLIDWLDEPALPPPHPYRPRWTAAGEGAADR